MLYLVQVDCSTTFRYLNKTQQKLVELVIGVGGGGILPQESESLFVDIVRYAGRLTEIGQAI